jgi:hypothetical protein
LLAKDCMTRLRTAGLTRFEKQDPSAYKCEIPKSHITPGMFLAVRTAGEYKPLLPSIWAVSPPHHIPGFSFQNDRKVWYVCFLLPKLVNRITHGSSKNLTGKHSKRGCRPRWKSKSNWKYRYVGLCSKPSSPRRLTQYFATFSTTVFAWRLQKLIQRLPRHVV